MPLEKYRVIKYVVKEISELRPDLDRLLTFSGKYEKTYTF